MLGKKYLMYIACFAIICLFCEYSLEISQAYQTTPRSPISLAFASIGAISLESRLDARAKIESAQSLPEMRKIMEKILDSLRIPFRSDQLRQNILESSIDYQYSDKQTRYYVSIRSNQAAGPTTISITIITSGQESILNRCSRNLAACRDWSWQRSYLFAGLLETNINADGRATIASVLNQNLGLQPLKTSVSQGTISCSGFSRKMADGTARLISEVDPINIQTTIMERNDQKSLIYIGIPLLPQELTTGTAGTEASYENDNIGTLHTSR